MSYLRQYYEYFPSVIISVFITCLIICYDIVPSPFGDSLVHTHLLITITIICRFYISLGKGLGPAVVNIIWRTEEASQRDDRNHGSDGRPFSIGNQHVLIPSGPCSGTIFYLLETTEKEALGTGRKNTWAQRISHHRKRFGFCGKSPA